MKEEYCPIHEVTKLIGGKWKMPLMYVIQSGPKRFGELRRTLSPITEQMLTKQLRELENHNLIVRNDFKTVPPKVEYSLTDFGKSLSGIINQYQEFGRKNKKQIILKLYFTALKAKLMNANLFVFILLMLPQIQNLYSQSISLLSTEDGLSNNIVYDIVAIGARRRAKRSKGCTLFILILLGLYSLF